MFEKALDQVLAGGGGPTVAALLVISLLLNAFLGRLVWKLWDRVSEVQNKCAETTRELYDKMLALQAPMLSALERTAQSQAGLAEAVNARRDVMDDLSMAVSKMADRQDAARGGFQAQADRLEKAIGANGDLLQRLLRTPPGARE